MSTSRNHLNRREFLNYLALGWIAFGAALGGFLSMALRYFYPNVNFEPEMIFVAGYPKDYEEGVDERWKNQFGVWVVKQEGKLFALSNICTHLGCVPTWMAAELKFKCPCHGSGYYVNGINFEGPAPRPLERYKITLNPEGKLLIDKTKVYRYEKGEWNHPNSFIAV